jgi:hypothetical protein
VELPERGPGGDMIGRTMARLAAVSADMSVTTVPGGWRISAGYGRDLRRADSFWREDLDALEEALAGYRGACKVQLVGPWSLAASVEDRAGERLLRDHGAVRDLAAALCHAVHDLNAELHRRLPDVTIALQIDEPLLADVVAGRIATQSTWTTYPAVDTATVTALLATIRAAHPGEALVHCCAPNPPFAAIAAADFSISFDVAAVGRPALEPVGEQIDAGRRVFLGVAADSAVDTVRRLGSAVGWQGAEWAQRIVLTPPCDLVDMSLSQARGTMERLAAAAVAIAEEG